MPPGVVTVGSTLVLLPLVGGAMAWSTGNPWVVVGGLPLALASGHILAGAPGEGLRYGLLGYPAIVVPALGVGLLATAVNPPRGGWLAGLENWFAGGLVGLACGTAYTFYVAGQANEAASQRRPAALQPPPRPPGQTAVAPAPQQPQAVQPPATSRGVGLTIGAVAGSGLTYAHPLPGGFGLRVAGSGAIGSEARRFWNLGGALTRDLVTWEVGTTPAACYALVGVDARGTVFDGARGLPAGSAIQLRLTPGLGLVGGPFYVEGGLSAYHAGGVGFEPAFGSGLLWRF
ncbi:MAG: hypothetical protein VKS61_02170 [Candidatus Sericytochromatia bacterium]|nr:hypothetical protein [Candidatus Sericytochromatia bacterium]